MLPQEALAAFDGLSPNTDWELIITDNGALVSGVLNSWGLELVTGIPLMIQVDTQTPQRPTIDLENSHDTGMMSLDNVTFGNAVPDYTVVSPDATMDFHVTFEPGSAVVIKDGNTVIDAFTVWSFGLGGIQEVPPVGGAGAGTGFVFLNNLTNELTWDIRFAGLSNAPVAAHFHGPAMFGENAGVELPITASLNGAGDAYQGSATITADQAEDLGSGLWYVNIHTALHPGGEIRGQVSQQFAPLPLAVFTDIPGVFANGITRTLTLSEGTHLLSTEVTDKVGNVSHQSQELIVTVDTTRPDKVTDVDMLDASDTGVDNQDNITSKMQPAFSGKGEPNNKVRVYAARKDHLTGADIGPRELVGQSIITSQGNWEITVEPLADGHYNIYAEQEDLAGNVSMINEVIGTSNAPMAMTSQFPMPRLVNWIRSSTFRRVPSTAP